MRVDTPGCAKMGGEANSKWPRGASTPEAVTPRTEVVMCNDSTPATTESTSEQEHLARQHAVNVSLLETDEWILPAFTDLLHELDSRMEAGGETLDDVVHDVLSRALSHDDWDGTAGFGMLTWIYFRYLDVKTETIASVLGKLSIRDHEETRMAMVQKALEVYDFRRVQHLKTMPYRNYLKSDHWGQIREYALEDAGYRCQLCNEPNKLQVHHRTYERRGEEKPGDLIVLCAGCHQHFHDKLKVQ